MARMRGGTPPLPPPYSSLPVVALALTLATTPTLMRGKGLAAWGGLSGNVALAGQAPLAMGLW